MSNRSRTGHPCRRSTVSRHIRSAIGTTDRDEMLRGRSTDRARCRTPRSIESPQTRSLGLPPEERSRRARDAVEATFAEPVGTRSGPVDVSCTFGIALDGSDAGRACWSSKSWRRSPRHERRDDRHRFKGSPPSAVRDLSIMGEMRRGIERRPVVRRLSAQIGFEERQGHACGGARPLATSRPKAWSRRTRFLPLAEETGAVREITRFVMRPGAGGLPRDTARSKLNIGFLSTSRRPTLATRLRRRSPSDARQDQVEPSS